MAKKLVACIGTGNMGGALMKAASSVIGGAEIVVTDWDVKKGAAFASEIGATAVSSNADAVKSARFIFLAVKPQVLSDVLASIAGSVADRIAAGDAPVLVSIVAGASVATIRSALSVVKTEAAACPIIRLMPNTPALVAKGMIALSADPSIPAPDIAELERVLSASGIVDRVEEKYMDAVTALSGSGPAFVYMFIEALSDAGVRAGLPRDKAQRYAARTVLGSAAMVEETGTHPGALKDAVCSPAGTTIAGVAALEEHGFRGATMAAVDAAFKRAQELGKKA
ncbi:MAG: pyrroline-5-carboxylate reductase [Treponemataceae bacterium]